MPHKMTTQTTIKNRPSDRVKALKETNTQDSVYRLSYIATKAARTSNPNKGSVKVPIEPRNPKKENIVRNTPLSAAITDKRNCRANRYASQPIPHHSNVLKTLMI